MSRPKLKSHDEYFTNPVEIDLDLDGIRASLAEEFEAMDRRALEDWNFLRNKIVGAEDP